MSSVAFTCFRALTRFGDLPLGAKLLRVTCFPYFLAKAAFSKDDTPPVTTPYKSLHELPSLEAVDPATQTRSPFSFEALKGRPVLVVNVASACGLTAQNYAELVEIYEPLKASKRLEVLAFPCDQFMHQEKGDTAEVCSFAAKKGAKWPVFDKVLVNGEGASPVYSFVKASSGNVADVEWNFAKFLVDGTGKVVKRYAPDVPPKALVKDIEAL